MKKIEKASETTIFNESNWKRLNIFGSLHASKPLPKTLNMSDWPDKVCWQSSLLCGDWGMAWTCKNNHKSLPPKGTFLVKLDSTNSALTNHNLQRDQFWYKCIQSIYIYIYTDQTCTLYLYILLILWQPLHQARTHGARHFQKTVHTFAASNKDRVDKPKSGGFHPTGKILLIVLICFNQLLVASSELHLYRPQKLQTGSEIQLPKETVVLKILPQAGRQMFKR